MSVRLSAKKVLAGDFLSEDFTSCISYKTPTRSQLEDLGSTQNCELDPQPVFVKFVVIIY